MLDIGLLRLYRADGEECAEIQKKTLLPILKTLLSKVARYLSVLKRVRDGGIHVIDSTSRRPP